jgi:hypothetical protein
MDSRKQLESAVGTIAERLSQTDGRSLEIEAEGALPTKFSQACSRFYEVSV